MDGDGVNNELDEDPDNAEFGGQNVEGAEGDAGAEDDASAEGDAGAEGATEESGGLFGGGLGSTLMAGGAGVLGIGVLSKVFKVKQY